MKKLILVSAVALLSSGAAIACPNLAGSFACAADEADPAFNVTTTQKRVGSTWAYTVEVIQADGSSASTEVLADGVSRSYTDSSGQISEPQSYTCEGDAALRMDSSFMDQMAGAVTMMMRISVDAQGSLHQVFEGDTANYGKFQGMKTCARL